MPRPLRAQLPRNSLGATVAQRVLDLPQRALGVRIDAVSPDHEQPPAESIQLLTPFDVPTPLGVVLGMLSAVVLNEQPKVALAQVEAKGPFPVWAAEDHVDFGFGQP